MIKFDLSDFSSDDEIESAVVSFYIKGFSSNAPCSLHTLERDFNVNDVTWDVAEGSNFWADDEATAVAGKDGETIYRGGEFDPSNVVSNPGVTSITGEWESYDVTSIVKEMVAGTRDNNGFVLKTFYNNSVLKVFHASESSIDSVRPKMEVTYKSTAIAFGAKNQKSGLFKVNQVGKNLKLSLAKKGLYDVSLTTLSGQTLNRVSFAGNESASIGTDGLAKGVYLLNVTGNGLKFTRNIILK